MSTHIMPLKYFSYDKNKTFEENKKKFIDDLTEYNKYLKNELKKIGGVE